jgi:hypothetical protein
MGNRFNYRCPECGSAVAIEISAFVSIRLTANGAEIAEDVQDIDGSCWSPESAAVRTACVFAGAVRDFAILPGEVSLGEFRRHR